MVGCNQIPRVNLAKFRPPFSQSQEAEESIPDTDAKENRDFLEYVETIVPFLDEPE